MAGTQIRSIRTTNVVNGSNTYEIVTTCIVKGTLSDVNIFVHNLVTDDDPKDDTLLRVAQVADFTEYLTDRDDAVAASAETWRASSVLLKFKDIETANAAWKELESRINTLVEQVDAFNDEFDTDGLGDITVFPATDPSELAALITAYEETAEPITDAVDARDTQQLTCTQAEADLVVVQERLTEAEGDLANYLTIQADVGNVNTSLPSISGAIAAAATQARVETLASSASALEITGINAQHSLIDAQITLFNVQNSALSTAQTGPINSAVATLQARVIALTTEKSGLVTTINACAITMATLDAVVDAARAAQTAALADVVAACATFTP
jgi:hypothetical protein